MTATSMKWLGAFATLMLLGVLLINVGSDEYSASDSAALLPTLEERINDIAEVALSQGSEAATIARGDDGWVVRERGNYPADTGKLREGLLALAEAKKIEAKTASPERHAQLGLAGDDRLDVRLSGDGVDAELVLGNVAQRSNRYVRLAGDDQSWLIDRNPALPADPSDWLVPELLDIASSNVASVTIRHADGETIEVVAGSDGPFEVRNIPDGRELSYGTVANSVAGALQGLNLEDVRAADEGAVPDITAVLVTKDGIEVTARRFPVGEGHWFSLQAVAQEAAAANDGAADNELADGAAAAAVASPEDRVAAINARTTGWHYRLPDYKANLLARRWEDLLKAPTADETE